MACLDMYNKKNEHKTLGSGAGAPISPRISFSNDFVVESSSSSHSHQQQMMMRSSYRDAPVSSDFEFSVSNYSMMSADELFSHGRLLPLKETCSINNQLGQKPTTLRDELRQIEDDDDDNEFSLRPPKSSTRWKGFLGLKKAHIGSRKIDKSQGSSGDKRSTNPIHEADSYHGIKLSQEMLNDGGSGSKNVEFR